MPGSTVRLASFPVVFDPEGDRKEDHSSQQTLDSPFGIYYEDQNGDHGLSTSFFLNLDGSREQQLITFEGSCSRYLSGLRLSGDALGTAVMLTCSESFEFLGGVQPCTPGHHRLPAWSNGSRSQDLTDHLKMGLTNWLSGGMWRQTLKLTMPDLSCPFENC